MIRVELTLEQELRAARVGAKRYLNARRNGLQGRHYNGSQWSAHIEAACSELAVALALGLPWSGEHVFEPPYDRPDVGDNIEVRHVGGGRLVLRMDERDLAKTDRVWVLVTGWAPSFGVVGAWESGLVLPSSWIHEYPERSVWEIPASELRPW